MDGCDRTHSHLGFCEAHANRFKKGTDLEAPIRKPSGIVECTLEGCSRPHEALGLCGTHAYTERRYNLTREQTVRLQGASCEICGGKDEGKNLAVDHDHSCCPGKGSCGKCVRGFLCGDCNRALGLVKDNPAVLRAAAQYLESHSAKTD